MARRNPDMETWLLLGAVGVGGYLLYKAWQNAQANSPSNIVNDATTPTTTPDTTTDGAGTQGSTTLSPNIDDPNGI